MITERDRCALKEGDIVSRKFRGGVVNYAIVATTLSKKYFWVRELGFGNDGFYDENHDLTEPTWSVVAGNVGAAQ